METPVRTPAVDPALWGNPKLNRGSFPVVSGSVDPEDDTIMARFQLGGGTRRRWVCELELLGDMGSAGHEARGMKTVVLLIQGMRDNACRERLAEALGSVAGVADANVSLLRARGVVTYGPPCDEELLLRTVKSVGYEASVVRGG